jgi:hypothetical protein
MSNQRVQYINYIFVTGRETNISYGLPTPEAIQMCKDVYSNDIVKLTLQIMDPNVMQINKDVSAKFSDQLGVVGMPIYFVQPLLSFALDIN